MFAIVALSGILSRLMSTGTIIVATSNRAPKDLNEVWYLLINHSWLVIVFSPVNQYCVSLIIFGGLGI